jgi:hypothetical protein
MAQSRTERARAVELRSHGAPANPENRRVVAARARHLAQALLETLRALEQAPAASVRRVNPEDDDEDPTRRARAEPS